MVWLMTMFGESYEIPGDSYGSALLKGSRVLIDCDLSTMVLFRGCSAVKCMICWKLRTVLTGLPRARVSCASIRMLLLNQMRTERRAVAKGSRFSIPAKIKTLNMSILYIKTSQT